MSQSYTEWLSTLGEQEQIVETARNLLEKLDLADMGVYEFHASTYINEARELLEDALGERYEKPTYQPY